MRSSGKVFINIECRELSVQLMSQFLEILAIGDPMDVSLVVGKPHFLKDEVFQLGNADLHNPI